jgi:endonuclease III
MVRSDLRCVRLNLQSWLPTELHRDINHMLVGFGQVCPTTLHIPIDDPHVVLG